MFTGKFIGQLEEDAEGDILGEIVGIVDEAEIDVTGIDGDDVTE